MFLHIEIIVIFSHIWLGSINLNERTRAKKVWLFYPPFICLPFAHLFQFFWWWTQCACASVVSCRGDRKFFISAIWSVLVASRLPITNREKMRREPTTTRYDVVRTSLKRNRFVFNYAWTCVIVACKVQWPDIINAFINLYDVLPN